MFHMLSFFKKKKTYNSKLSYPGQSLTIGFRDQEKGGEDGRTVCIRLCDAGPLYSSLLRNHI